MKSSAIIDVRPKTSPLHQHKFRAELFAAAKAKRESCHRKSHKEMPFAKNRNPLAILSASNRGRIPELIPIRYGRMLKSPFTFFRGAAAIMASDLSATPKTGAVVQACGDAHLLNFGVFATPERKLVFDINDFDETLPAPWEWDVKRLAASFVIACYDNKFSKGQTIDATRSFLKSYREKLSEYSEMRVLEVWYDHIEVLKVIKGFGDEETKKRAKKRLKKAQTRDVAIDDFPILAHTDRKEPIIRDNPPLIYHHKKLKHAEFASNVESAFSLYRESLPFERRVLLDRYQLKDIANKVVGVGSVGTLCAIMLMMAEKEDPLFLQVKEARQSVLEPYVKKSPFATQGQRVVVGQRLMQSASDLFLGWTVGQEGRHFYIRQLRDMKVKPQVELFNPSFMAEYAGFCGWALAHAHARSGEPAFLSGYLGKSEAFDEAVTDFALAYAEQNERDYDSLLKAAKSGKIEVYFER